MDSYLVLLVYSLNLLHRAHALGCQHDCDCGFSPSIDDTGDNDFTMRYEVLGGLCGAFAPIITAGVTYLLYRRFCSPTSSSIGPRGSPGTPWDEFNSKANQKGQGRTQPMQSGHSRPPPVSSPTSLYGETDSGGDNNNMMTNKGSPPGYGTLPSGQGDAPGSKWVNIHRNVEKDDANIWFKNVNKVKQFY